MALKKVLTLATLLKVLNMLDRGETITRNSLAADFGVNPRTIDRGISQLQLAGYPISYDRTRLSYVFEEGYHLKRSELSSEEELVLAIARSMVKKFGAGTNKIFDSIENKMTGRHFQTPKHLVLVGEDLSPRVEKYFDQLNHAIIDNRQVELVYHATRKGDEKSCRIVDPYYLFFVDYLWYLRAYCHKAEKPLTFALDKIAALKVLTKSFIPDRKLCPVEELQYAFGPYVDGEPTEVVLRFDKKYAPYIRRKKWQKNQKIKELRGERIEVRYKVKGLAGIKPWILRWIPYVEVVAPKELKALIAEELMKAMRIFEKKNISNCIVNTAD